MTAPVQLVETIEVRMRASGADAVINRADFDETLHEARSAPTAESAPADAAPTAESAPADADEKSAGGKRKRS